MRICQVLGNTIVTMPASSVKVLPAMTSSTRLQADLIPLLSLIWWVVFHI